MLLIQKENLSTFLLIEISTVNQEIFAFLIINIDFKKSYFEKNSRTKNYLN